MITQIWHEHRLDLCFLSTTCLVVNWGKFVVLGKFVCLCESINISNGVIFNQGWKGTQVHSTFFSEKNELKVNSASWGASLTFIRWSYLQHWWKISRGDSYLLWCFLISVICRLFFFKYEYEYCILEYFFPSAKLSIFSGGNLLLQWTPAIRLYLMDLLFIIAL